MSASGRFVWLDLMTNDVEAAKAFYTHVIGWTTTAWNHYTMWAVGERTVGGVMDMPENAKGMPPHWLGYASVDDVDAACARAKELGGAVHVPGTDIPEVGRFAVLADPQGAAFAVFAPNGEMPVLGGDTAGGLAWSELNAKDYESAWDFYSALLGWKHTSDFDMGSNMGRYFMFASADGGAQAMGGMSNAATMMNAPPHWLFYINVEDIDAAVQRVRAKGGKVLNGPMEVPDASRSRIAQCMDPSGAAFALFSPGRG
jgi:predicted enzyme related to lactoylglutathione lyase